MNLSEFISNAFVILNSVLVTDVWFRIVCIAVIYPLRHVILLSLASKW